MLTVYYGPALRLADEGFPVDHNRSRYASFCPRTNHAAYYESRKSLAKAIRATRDAECIEVQ